jgi:hypothetical protein
MTGLQNQTKCDGKGERTGAKFTMKVRSRLFTGEIFPKESEHEHAASIRGEPEQLDMFPS